MAIIGINGKKDVGKDIVGQAIQYLIWKKANSEHLYSGNLSELFSNKNMIFVPKEMRGFIGIAKESNWRIVKFADKLKDIVCLLIGCTREQLEDHTFKETILGEEWWYYKGKYDSIIPYNESSLRSKEDLVKPTPRVLLQQIGTDLFRNQLHPQVWVNATMSNYRPIQYHDGLDFYHKNEYPNWIITDCRFPNEVKAIKDRGGIVIRVNRYTNNVLINNDTYAMTDWQHPSETALDDYQEFDYVIDNAGTIEKLIEKVKEILIKEKIL